MGPLGPGGLQVGPAWQWLGPRFGVESSRVFWNLLELISLRISMILFDDLILLEVF